MWSAHLVLGFAFAGPAFEVIARELSASKQLGFWFGNPLTRRSPDTHFMRFGRSGGSGSGSGGVASKLHAKCRACRLAATVEAYLSPTLSLTCAPDADVSSRLICRGLLGVGRHSSVVTERSCDHHEDDCEREDESVDSEAEGSADDGQRDARAATDKPVEADDGGPANESEKGTGNRTARQSIEQRSGRSTASQAPAKSRFFAKFGRGRDTFMRLGRAGLDKYKSTVDVFASSRMRTPEYPAGYLPPIW